MSIFNVLGPVMIGPSSSHTAGAVRIGRMARLIFGEEFEAVKIFLHGSFASTATGHGTDKALVGGLMGFQPDDERIRNSLEYAKDRNISITFDTIQLKNVHPNTARIKMIIVDNSMEITASSIGGGEIVVKKIDDYDVEISGRFPTIWTVHSDKPGKINQITSALSKNRYNIAYMQVFRKKKGKPASSIIELDNKVEPFVIKYLQTMDDIFKVRYVPSL